MDVQVTAFAPSSKVELLSTTLARVGFSPIVSDGEVLPAGQGIELLYVSECRRNDADIQQLVHHRVMPFDLLLSDRPELFCQPGLVQHAVDFCRWPSDDVELQARLRRASLSGRTAPGEGDTLSGLDACVATNLVGDSPAFRAVLHRIKRLAQVDVNVLITGDSGTGKEVVARALHYLGPRRDRCFQAINCGAIPESLVENELFGHVSGAYTDARHNQAGLVEQAQEGALFLDEVDTLPPKAQTALLRFIESRCYRPLGGREERHADTRIIAATNARLDEKVEQGAFRLDLYYRLNLLSVRLPALCQRTEDIGVLARHFLAQCEVDYRQGGKVLHPYTLEQMQCYHWPGNIRELEHFIQREYLLCDAQVIVASPDPDAVLPEPVVAGYEPVGGFREAKEQAISRFESEYVHTLLTRTHGNVTRAAQLAGKERRSFGRLVKKHGFDPRQFY